MTTKNKKSEGLKASENVKNKKAAPNTADFNEIDLGDADDSSGNLGMDNFKAREDKDKLPSERGRIEEL